MDFFTDTCTLPDLYTFLHFCLYLGMFIILRSVYRFVRSLYTYDLLYGINFYRRTPRIVDYTATNDRSLPWALVTNTGSELGAEFAKRLAELGFNVVLHDSDYLKVQDLLRVLRTDYPARDFRFLIPPESDVGDDKTIAHWAAEGAGGITLKVFVNVIAQPPIGDVDGESLDLDLDKYLYCPTVVLAPLLRVLMRFAPTLLLNVETPRRLAMSGHLLEPPCKAYVRELMLRVARQMKELGQKVEVIHFKVGQLGGSGEGESSLRQPSVSTFVKSALARVGCGEPVLAPYIPHALMAWWPTLLPRFFRESLRIFLLRDWISKRRRFDAIALIFPEAGPYPR
ncbi:hypothetical protein GGR51DRAFT_566813 [Nemania sp. FL0031]|nr:hypothetical protein GGR51DRAFT_566813 [Nemania sp. FL0031]